MAASATSTTAGGRSCSSTRRRQRLVKADPAVARVADRLCRTYAILSSDGDVITVGHRYRRVPR